MTAAPLICLSFKLCLKAGKEAVRLFVKRNFSRDGKNQAEKPRGRLNAVFGGR